MERTCMCVCGGGGGGGALSLHVTNNFGVRGSSSIGRQEEYAPLGNLTPLTTHVCPPPPPPLRSDLRFFFEIYCR